MAKYRKLSRTSDQRKALLRNQVTNLLYNGKIVTTEATNESQGCKCKNKHQTNLFVCEKQNTDRNSYDNL